LTFPDIGGDIVFSQLDLVILQGAGTKLATTTGAFVEGNFVTTNAAGTFIDGGSVPGEGGAGVDNPKGEATGADHVDITHSFSDPERIMLDCWDNLGVSVGNYRSWPNATTIRANFGVVYDGQVNCAVSGLSSGGGGGSGGAVSSVFGRVGVVVAEPGDYDYVDIGGAILDMADFDASIKGGTGTAVLSVETGSFTPGNMLTKDANGRTIDGGAPTGGDAAPGGVDGSIQTRVNSTTFGGINNATATRMFVKSISSVASVGAILSEEIPANYNGYFGCAATDSFGAITGPSGCQTVTVTCTGALTGSSGTVAPATAPASGLVFEPVLVPAPNQARVMLCNKNASGSITPGSIDMNIDLYGTVYR
jgi:hypothetical protein